MVNAAKDMLMNIHKIHFVGIGGSGMSPLAEILFQKGYAITGSDVNESDNIKRMRSLGITVWMQQTAENVQDTELVVYTAAVSMDNPELAEAQKRGIPTIERAQLLGEITSHYSKTVAVAGTHGKTTTTSMLSQILIQGGFDPSVFIGGRLPLIGANGKAGASDIMVCEACEFKDHYLQMKPAISIILNVDADHLDYFGSLENVIASFNRFAQLTTEALIVNLDDAHAMKAVADMSDKKVITYGVAETCEWTAHNISFVRGCFGVYDLHHNGEFFAHITLGVPGSHNIHNSMAAAAAAFLCGASAEQIAEGILSFQGAGRRFEFLGEVDGITIADDYAHHPTEITATLKTAKAMGYNRVWGIFQPFTFSRTARHLNEFADSLRIADRVVVSDIMGSRETNEYQVSSQQITDQIEHAVYLPTFEEITDYVAANAQSGDLILTMGGGDVYKCARMIKAELEKKQSR